MKNESNEYTFDNKVNSDEYEKLLIEIDTLRH